MASLDIVCDVNMQEVTNGVDQAMREIGNRYDFRGSNCEIIFDKKTLELKGWETRDVYSNDVSFLISNMQINNQIMDSFFKIPSEKDL